MIDKKLGLFICVEYDLRQYICTTQAFHNQISLTSTPNIYLSFIDSKHCIKDIQELVYANIRGVLVKTFTGQLLMNLGGTKEVATKNGMLKLKMTL